MAKMDFEQTEENNQAEQAAFSAVFDVTDEAAKDPAPAVTEEEPAATQPEEVTDPESPKPITMDDVSAILATQKAEQQKTFDRIFGTVGDLKARSEKLEAFQSKMQGMSKRQQDKLAGEFPELAAIMFEESDEEPEPVRQPERQQVAIPDPVDNSELFEKRLLKRDHPDWETVVRSKEFEAWRQTLDPETATEVLSSSDADFISPKLTEFKAWKTGQITQTEKAKQTQTQLAAAVNPRGTPRSAVAGKGADDEENAAFKAAFKPRFIR
jgi:hypothetical protein